MTKIDEIAGSEGVLEKGAESHSHDAGHGEGEVHVPHLPLTGTQKLICVVELILAAMFTVFIFSTIITHVINLPGRI